VLRASVDPCLRAFATKTNSIVVIRKARLHPFSSTGQAQKTESAKRAGSEAKVARDDRLAAVAEHKALAETKNKYSSHWLTLL
jgi:hypothetical protein